MSHVFIEDTFKHSKHIVFANHCGVECSERIVSGWRFTADRSSPLTTREGVSCLTVTIQPRVNAYCDTFPIAFNRRGCVVVVTCDTFPIVFNRCLAARHT